MAAWSIQEAEHSAREVFQRAFTGEPQIVVSNRVPSIVIISYADYESHASIPKIDPKARISAKKEPSLVEALLSCPCDISDLIEDRRNRLKPWHDARYAQRDRHGGFWCRNRQSVFIISNPLVTDTCQNTSMSNTTGNIFSHRILAKSV